MLLKTDEIIIVEDEPFRNDVLNRKESGDVLTEFVLSANSSLVVCIDAPWGQGKTTFLRMWEQELKIIIFPLFILMLGKVIFLMMPSYV